MILRRKQPPEVTEVKEANGQAAEPVLCEVDGSPTSTDDVQAAIARCQEAGAELELVGVLKETAAGNDSSEHARRVSEVQGALIRAARAAREAGIPIRVTSMCC